MDIFHIYVVTHTQKNKIKCNGCILVNIYDTSKIYYAEFL
jgi:hypothetical protein